MKQFYSTAELAKALGISRIAVFKRIQSGEIPAEKVGRNYVIRAAAISDIVGGELTKERKRTIEASVRRTVKEFGQTLKLLAKE